MKKLIAVCSLLALLLSGCTRSPNPENVAPTSPDATEPSSETEATSEPLASKDDGGFGL